MAITNNAHNVFHRVRVKLYPNYLPGVEGAYIARTDDEASLTVEQVCAKMKSRGGFTGNYADLVGHVKQYFNEAAYQLCDGYAINTGYYSLHPRIGGTFHGADEGADGAKHPVSFAFRTLQPLRDLAKYIEIFVAGVADTNGYIGRLEDMDSETVDQDLTPGGVVVIFGDKIKVEGDDSAVGVYFVNTADGTRVKVQKRLSENRSGKVIAVVPSGMEEGTYRLEIVTRFTRGQPLKEARTISYNPELRVV